MLDRVFSSFECMINNANVCENFYSSDHKIMTLDLLYDLC